MDVLSAIIYGIIQGVTEFLPISSSGHLALAPAILKIKDPGVAFDLTMHLGTALAVIVYFRSDLFKMFGEFGSVFKLKKFDPKKSPYLFNIILSTFVTGVIGLTIKNIAATWGRSPIIIASNLFLFGLIMWLFDLWGSRERDNAKDELMTSHLEVKKSLLIGLFQALAVFPGVSRSGATLSISRILGLNRYEAARYSFILSLPIILAGFLLKLPELSGEINITITIIGVLVSFVVGMISIHWFLKIISKWGLVVFFIYRAILALVVIIIFN